MRAVDRVVLNEIVGPFFGSVLLFTSLFLAAGELKKLTEFANMGVPWSDLLVMVGFTLPFVLAYTIPMAMLLATLLGFGRLSSDSEIIALFASGTGFPRIMAPVAGFALIIALPIVVANQGVIPAANHKREVMARQIRQRGSATAGSATEAFHLAVKNGEGERLIVHAEGGVRFGAGGVAYLDRVGIFIFSKGQPVAAIGAPRAQWKLGTRQWTLAEDAAHPIWMARQDSVQGPTMTQSTNVSLKEIELGTPEELAALEGPVTEQSSPVLYQRARVRRQEGDHVAARQAEIEAAQRISYPLAAVIFALVGAPLGIQRTRSGKGLGFGLSVIITFVYWTLVQVFQGIGNSGGMSPQLACQLPNLLGLGIAGWLIGRVTQWGAVN